MPPGTYEVELAAGDRIVTRSVHLTMDPRIAADGVTQADHEEQYELARRVQATMEEARAADERVQEGMEKAEGRALEAFQALDRRLNTVEGGSYQTPMLQAQLSYLYSMLNRADQKPGRDAYVRLEQLQAELAEIEAELERLERMVA